MRHLGPRFLNSKSREFRFRFSVFALPSPPLGLSSGSSGKVRRPGALSLHPISIGPVNRRVHFMRWVHFMRSSLNRRVHFMRSSLTRLLQVTSGAAIHCHHPAYLMQLLWYQLALGLFRSLVVLFRPLRAPPISSPLACSDLWSCSSGHFGCRLCHHPAYLMQLLWYQLALGLFRSMVVLPGFNAVNERATAQASNSLKLQLASVP